MAFVYVERNPQGDIIAAGARPVGSGRPERLPDDDAEVVSFLESLNPPRAPAQRGHDAVRLFKALKANGLIDDADYDAQPRTPLRVQQ